MNDNYYDLRLSDSNYRSKSSVISNKDRESQSEEIIKPKNVFKRNLQQSYNTTNEFNIDELDSKLMMEPIIKKENFRKLFSSKWKDHVDLRLLDYTVLKEIIDSCGSYPEKYRTYLWKFLLSLPGNHHLFNSFSSKGIHPFYKNLRNVFPVKNSHLFKKLQLMCSALTYWSPHIGNVYFLPDLVFPIVKSFKGDDLFVFELMVALLNAYCQYWFEFYPGAPLNHLKLCEKIIEKERSSLAAHLKKLQVKFGAVNVKLSEIIWSLMKSNFSEVFIRENWLQYMDFILTHNHHPEILMYFAIAFLLQLEKPLLKCKDHREVEQFISTTNKTVHLQKMFKKTLNLYNKYKSYQIYKYKPYVPFPEERYPAIDKFPLDFLQTTAQLREDLFKEEENFSKKEKQINDLEEKFNELLKKEQMMQKTYEGLIDKEKEKAKLMERELKFITGQKEKYYDEIKQKKLNKATKLQKVIDSSVKFYDQMNEAELDHFNQEMKTKKHIEEFDLKKRLQQEELNNIEFESNRRLIDLLNLRNKEEGERKYQQDKEYREQERNVMKRLLEEKWKLEDEEQMKLLENERNLKEFNIIKKKESQKIHEKQQKEKLQEFEEKLMLQQVERERQQRNLLNQFELNKEIVDNQFQNRDELNKEEAEKEIKKIMEETLKKNQKKSKQNAEVLLKKLKENMTLIEKEEKELLKFEHDLRKRELERNIEDIKNQGKARAIEEDRKFEEQLRELEQQKKRHQEKKREFEAMKKDLKNNMDEMKQSYKQNVDGKEQSLNDNDKYAHGYSDFNRTNGYGETDKPQSHNFSNSQLTAYDDGYSNQDAEFTKTKSLQEINKGIRDAARNEQKFKNTRGEENYPDQQGSGPNDSFGNHQEKSEDFSNNTKYNEELYDYNSNNSFNKGDDKYEYKTSESNEDRNYDDFSSQNYNEHSFNTNNLVSSGNYPISPKYNSKNPDINTLGSLSLSASNR